MSREMKTSDVDSNFRGYFMLLPESSETEKAGGINAWSILDLVWARRWTVLIFILVGSAVAAAYAFFVASPMYRSTALVVYRDTDISPASSIGQQFGGLASLAGINLAAGGSKGAEQFAVLSSKNMLKILVVRDKIIPILFSNAGHLLGFIPRRAPSVDSTAQYLMDKVITVEQDKKTSLITVSAVSKDPALAAKWVSDLVAITNEYLRSRATSEAQRNIGYLAREGATNAVESVREALVQLTARNLNQAMLANVQTDFAFKTVDPAEVREPRDFYYPNRAIFLLSGAILGLLSGAAYVLWPHREAFKAAGATASPTSR